MNCPRPPQSQFACPRPHTDDRQTSPASRLNRTRLSPFAAAHISPLNCQSPQNTVLKISTSTTLQQAFETLVLQYEGNGNVNVRRSGALSLINLL